MPDVQILGKLNKLQMDTTNISSLPVIQQSLQGGPMQQSMFNQSSQQQQQPPQSMYQSLSDITGGGGGGGGRFDTPILTSDEPMPANMGGGGSFGTAW